MPAARKNPRHFPVRPRRVPDRPTGRLPIRCRPWLVVWAAMGRTHARGLAWTPAAGACPRAAALVLAALIVKEGRRELTEGLLEARPVAPVSRPEKWRWRKRSIGLDISAQVVIEDGMAVVVHVGIRPDGR